ncbi:hypothetical protein CRUP_013424 [Coryphaenoides rupestris]|nr:hypothetical protein CRUP_013424 [Coryphaenoides rupestris]
MAGSLVHGSVPVHGRVPVHGSVPVHGRVLREKKKKKKKRRPPKPKPPVPCPTKQRVRPFVRCTVPPSPVTVVRQEYEVRIKGLLPAELQRELQDTISSLKAQVGVEVAVLGVLWGWSSPKPKPPVPCPTKQRVRPFVRCTVPPSPVTVVRQEYEVRIKGLLPAELQRELQDTISSLKAQVGGPREVRVLRSCSRSVVISTAATASNHSLSACDETLWSQAAFTQNITQFFPFCNSSNRKFTSSQLPFET